MYCVTVEVVRAGAQWVPILNLAWQTRRRRGLNPGLRPDRPLSRHPCSAHAADRANHTQELPQELRHDALGAVRPQQLRCGTAQAMIRRLGVFADLK
jgi:hypothetical protein